MNKNYLLVLAVLLSAGAHAGEFRVAADVVKVEPIARPGTEVEECGPKPGAGLSATLAWDLGRNCTSRVIPSNEVSGYRVFYRWDEKVYSQVMADQPGATIPLRVRVD